MAENIAKLAFCKDGYFTDEFDRIFKDIFREERIYKEIIKALSKYKNLKLPEITSLLKMSGGGGFVEYMENLELAGFVKSMTPIDKTYESKLKRYRLDDEYLLYYFKFIYPNLKTIHDNTQESWAYSVQQGTAYKSWAGFAFERLCLRHTDAIIKYLKIDQLVKAYGPYFNKYSNTIKGSQIDLMFVRHDPVITVCEMKYHNALIGKWIVDEMEKKISALNEKNKTIEKVLITLNGATADLIESNYFSRIIKIEELFKESKRGF